MVQSPQLSRCLPLQPPGPPSQAFGSSENDMPVRQKTPAEILAELRQRSHMQAGTQQRLSQPSHSQAALEAERKARADLEISSGQVAIQWGRYQQDMSIPVTVARDLSFGGLAPLQDNGVPS